MAFDPERGSSPRSWRRAALGVLRWGVTLAIAMAVVHRVWLEKEKLAAYDLHLAPAWLVASGLLYILGLATCAYFWWLAMRDLGGRPSGTSTLAAYYAGHLGKYVPGKALTVVVRSTMVRGPNVTIALAAFTDVLESVLMMATGALVALLAFASIYAPAHRQLFGIAVVLVFGFGLLTLPPVVARFGKLLSRVVPQMAAATAQTFRWRTLAAGTAIVAVGWLLMGLSLAALLAAMNGPACLLGHMHILRALALLTAMVALSTVGGFVTFTPGGLGAREWLLLELLKPWIGPAQAIVAAVLLRLVWIVAEVGAAGLFWLLDSRWRRLQIRQS
jgi:glycosyltransferase 2 family protein